MANTLTLLDTASLENLTVTDKQIYTGMFESRLPSPIEYIPIANAQAFTQRTLRLTQTKAPTTRNIGAAAGTYAAKFSDRDETIKIIHDKITLDVEQMEIKDYIIDPIEAQFQQYGLDLKHHFNDLLINGNPGTDDTQPAGLAYRLNNDATFLSQSVDAAGLSVGANDTNRNSFLDKIDEAITLCGGGNPDIMAVNRQYWLRFRSLLRQLKLFDTTKDQYDRMIMTYGPIKIVDAGLKAANSLSPLKTGQVVLDDATTSIFGTASTTPIYFIATGGHEGVKLLQVHGLLTKRLGVNPNSPDQYVCDARTTIGLFTPVKFCISSLQGLKA